MVTGFAREKKLFFTRYARRKCPLWITCAWRWRGSEQGNGLTNADNGGSQTEVAGYRDICGYNLRVYPQQAVSRSGRLLAKLPSLPCRAPLPQVPRHDGGLSSRLVWA